MWFERKIITFVTLVNDIWYKTFIKNKWETYQCYNQCVQHSNYRGVVQQLLQTIKLNEHDDFENRREFINKKKFHLKKELILSSGLVIDAVKFYYDI